MRSRNATYVWRPVQVVTRLQVEAPNWPKHAPIAATLAFSDERRDLPRENRVVQVRVASATRLLLKRYREESSPPLPPVEIRSCERTKNLTFSLARR